MTITQETEVDSKQAAEFAVQFMQRVQLTGQEVPAFNAAMLWLESVVNESEKDD